VQTCSSRAVFTPSSANTSFCRSSSLWDVFPPLCRRHSAAGRVGLLQRTRGRQPERIVGFISWHYWMTHGSVSDLSCVCLSWVYSVRLFILRPAGGIKGRTESKQTSCCFKQMKSCISLMSQTAALHQQTHK